MGKKYNPEEYEPVKSRKLKFYDDHVDGRIIVENMSNNIMEYALIKATIYFDKEDHLNGCPKSTGYAHEIRLTELSTSREGKEYEAVNYSSWVENAEESAIGRALDNAGYSGNKKCSREEMEKVKRMQEDKKQKINNQIKKVKDEILVISDDKLIMEIPDLSDKIKKSVEDAEKSLSGEKLLMKLNDINKRANIKYTEAKAVLKE